MATWLHHSLLKGNLVSLINLNIHVFGLWEETFRNCEEHANSTLEDHQTNLGVESLVLYDNSANTDPLILVSWFIFPYRSVLFLEIAAHCKKRH